MEEIERPSSLYIHLDIDIVCITLLVLALATRLYILDQPHYIVWVYFYKWYKIFLCFLNIVTQTCNSRFDELHYGRYVTLYTKGVFFFDAHPPLGKQLLYLAGRAAGYDGNFTFDRIGSPYTENVPVKALRLIPAIAGSLIVSLTYQLMLEVSCYQWTALLAALLILFGKNI